jgi:hypothetical protein
LEGVGDDMSVDDIMEYSAAVEEFLDFQIIS